MISIFLSYPKPFNSEQEKFITTIKEYLKQRGFEPRTLGVTDYDMDEPLTAIRRLMLESNGLLTIAFKRTLIESGKGKPNSDIGEIQYDLSNKWITSPYCQIEPAMAFQIGLPILILREEGVIADGILERGVTGTYLPEFDLSKSVSYLDNKEWQQIIGKWEGFVRKVVDTKGYPPKLY
ncbi:hypothetical protein [Zunongwangia sp.]|uniref:hypothetical protein n=1 Tax=Zunongwangia sp. TaxID=1965325 RepID=UPI003AA973C2